MERRAASPRSAVRLREERHRRAVMFGLGLLILLAMSPIFGHHLGSRIDRVFAGMDHVGGVCLIALHELLEPVHELFHLFLVAGVLYAAWDRLRARRRLRSVLSSLAWEAPALDGAISRAALRGGVDPARIGVADGLPTPAFTSGWWRPRIYLARELEHRLGDDELTAVIAHEGAHARRRDPLRLTVLRFVAHVLFWMPVLRRLAEDWADDTEIRADDSAARDLPLALASALLQLAQWRSPALSGGVGFNERDLLERRVRRLAGDEVEPRSHVTRRSVLGAALMLGLVGSTGTVMAHPMPPGHLTHCAHPYEAAWRHLFCLRATPARANAPCPHVSR